MILNKEQIKKDSLNYINRYIVNNVSVFPESEFRTNIKMNRISDEPKTSIFTSSSRRFMLPSYNDSYHVYSFRISDIFGFIPTVDTWIRSDLLNDQYNIYFDIYTNNGLMIPKSAVFVTAINSFHREVLIAIPFSILLKLGIPEDFQPEIDPNVLYLTMFSFKNTIIKKAVYSHTPLNNLFTTIDNFLTSQNTSNMEVYINGVNYDPSIAGDIIKYEDMIDLYIDENKVFTHTFDLENLQSYTSSNENESVRKNIIHIPKELNEDRRIYTYDEMRMFIRTEEDRGIFFSYIGDPTVSQLTFNDISITTYVINALEDYIRWKLPNENITKLVIDYYNYNDPSYFIANGNQIEKLYNNETNENIIKHLKLSLSNTLTSWYANNLEISQYISDIYNFKYNSYDVEQISDHIKSLGYYEYMSLISPTIFKYTDLTEADTIIISKPVIWKSVTCIPIVYINGIKISNTSFTYNESNNEINIVFTGETTFTTDDIIIIRLLPEFNNDITLFTPVDINNTFTCKKQNLIIYMKKDIPTYSIKGYFDDPNIEEPVYKKILDFDPDIPDTDMWNTLAFYIQINSDDDSLIDIIFKQDSFNKEFYIQPKDFNSYINIPFSITQKESVVFDLKSANSLFIKSNILNINSVDVFLNGKTLINNIDYKLNELKNINDEYRGYQLAMNNIDYLQNPDNILEVYTSSIISDEEKTDYVIDNKIMRDENIELWIPKLSYLIADGEIFTSDEIVQVNNHLEFKDYVFDNGTLCSLKTSIPKTIKNIFSEYEDPEYFLNITRINNYLFPNNPVINPDPILVQEPIKLYSVYLNTIINKILSDNLPVTYSSNINDILDQISDYNFLKEFDILITDLNNLNLDFIDIYPVYLSDLIVPNIPESMKNKYLVIHALTKYYLGSDIINNGEIVF